MYCVIQEVEIVKIPKGEPMRIEPYESSFTINGIAYTSYKYCMSEERFGRAVKKAYRISIHQSYREGGKVRKRQWVICSISYYDLIDNGSWYGDYIRGSLKPKLQAIGIEEDQLTELVYQKLQPIVDQVQAEFQKTEEYKAKEEHRRFLKEHEKRIQAFMKKYGVERSEYSYCYDVFGTLRNPDYLRKLKEEKEYREEYERRSKEYERSYYEKYRDTYSGSSGSGYGGIGSSNHSDEQKELLKKFYRSLSKTYHPDCNPGQDTSKEMKLLNDLKKDWGV